MLSAIQKELKPWQLHNFGARPSWQPLLGMIEELGELAHAYLKRAQGIRVTEDHEAKIKDAVADLFVYVCDFCNAEGIELDDLPVIEIEGRHAHRLVLAASYRVGKVAELFLEQDGRHVTVYRANLRDAVEAVFGVVCCFCKTQNIDPRAELQATWDRVKQRDWKANPKTGVA